MKMARRRKPRRVDALIADMDAWLQAFGEERSAQSLREKVVRLVELREYASDLNVSVLREHGWVTRSARERIRLYLVEYVGDIIDGAELAVVSGIGDYPRRIRELRVEHGYQIASGSSPDPESGIELKPDQYMLVCPDPDMDAARRWHIANRIRRSDLGSRDKVLAYLVENVHVVVTTDELSHVAKNAKQYARRLRELRTEHGYAIASRFTGRPDLSMGQYVLESADRVAAPHDRNIPESVQKIVYERDDNACRICGWSRASWRADDPRILELHHLDEHQHGGQNISSNLVVLCSRCHDGVHAGDHQTALDGIRAALEEESE